MSHTLTAPRPREAAPSRRFGPRLILLLLLVWVMLFGLSAGGRADETQPVSVEASSVALSGSTKARLQKMAPRLQVSAWVDRSGTITPPRLKGKVQLVVFWGVNCPACLKKIPRLQQTAKRYENTDLVVIGMHNARISPARAAQFARQRDLNYLIAIDRTGSNRYSFGVTSTAYDVQAIPHAAVVDRDGSLKFVGDFDEALETAETLVKASAG